MLDPDVKVQGLKSAEPVWEPKGRHMAQGFLPAGKGRRPKGPQVSFEEEQDKPEVEAKPRVPNRHERRREAALAPRNIRMLIRQNKWIYQFRHQSHYLAPKRWLDPESLKMYEESKDQERTTTRDHGKKRFIFETHGKFVRRQLKNALRRRRQKEAA